MHHGSKCRLATHAGGFDYFIYGQAEAVNGPTPATESLAGLPIRLHLISSFCFGHSGFYNNPINSDMHSSDLGELEQKLSSISIMDGTPL